MKKVLFITPRFYPDKGGVENHVEEIAENLIEKGYKVTVLTVSDDAQARKREVKDSIEILRITGVDRLDKVQIWRRIVGLRQQFAQADIVHVHDVFWWLFPVYTSIRKKVYCTFHGWEGRYPIPLKNKLWRYLFSYLSRKTIHVGAWIQEFYFDTPDAVTYGGISNKCFDDRLHTSNSRETKIAFVGRLEKENDIEAYLQIIAKLQKKIKNIRVTFVGGGSYQPQCQKIGEITGMIGCKRVLDFIQDVDFIFAASYLSILQAQAVGKIVVATYSHRLKQRYLETYSGAKYMIISGDQDYITRQIVELNKDKKRKKRLERAVRIFARKQTWKKVTQLYINLWQIN